jgi:ATP-binding cassette subfamily C protein CydD/ATP-binding cassette subfamily C protein CydCD
MRLPRSLRPARTLATAAIIRRGALLAVLALVERVLTAATAWVLFSRPLGVKLVVSVALGAVFASRAFLVKWFSARSEAELMDRAIRSVLDGDVLNASVLPGEDAHAELGKGVFISAMQLTELLPVLAGDLAAALLLTFAILAIEPIRLVVGAILLTAVAASGLMWSRGRLQRASQEAWTRHERLQEAMADALEGRLDIVASGARAEFSQRARQLAGAWGTAGMRIASSALITGRLPLLAIACGIAIAVTVDSSLRDAIPVSLADVALFASVTPAFAGIGQGVLALAQAEPWVLAVARVVESGVAKGDEDVSPSRHDPIVFESVSFRYTGSSADALANIDFTWGDERIVTILGANGSGKSTWLRLVLGLGVPQRGRILLGGVKLAGSGVDEWRRTVAFLPQRPYLPPRADIRSAVHLLEPSAPDVRIAAALERVGLLESLRRLSADPLAVRVDSLSVGQRQRVALARMLCRHASLFVLDEPDANLDSAGVALVADLVRALSREQKVLIAAHTPELIALADRVVELEQGRVVRDRRVGVIGRSPR